MGRAVTNKNFTLSLGRVRNKYKRKKTIAMMRDSNRESFENNLYSDMTGGERQLSADGNPPTYEQWSKTQAQNSIDAKPQSNATTIVVSALDTIKSIWGKPQNVTDSAPINVDSESGGGSGMGTGTVIGLSVVGLAVIGTIIYFAVKK